MLPEGASCQEASCSDLYINRNIARAALTAVWRYRLLLEAGREVAVVISIPAEGRAEWWLLVIPVPAAGRADGVPACDFHSCCEDGRRVPVCDSLSSGTVVPVGGGMAGLSERLSFIPSACMSLRQQASPTSGLPYRNLNQRDPLLRVFLVPYAVNVACAWLSGYLHAVLVHVSESLGECLVETLVRSCVLHA